jgi:5-methyltetrahydrofolate--homocysteine methyltransferase
MEDLKKLHDAILVGNFKQAREITEKALAEKVEPQTLVQKYMIPAMDEVGRRYEANEYFVPELLIAARAMKASLELIRPLLVASGAQFSGRVAIGTVKGDLHDIGKNLVAAMSALLTTTMGSMKTIVEAIKSAGLRDKVKIIIGGAPVTDKYASEIGADGYSSNANGAVALARKLMAA